MQHRSGSTASVPVRSTELADVAKVSKMRLRNSGARPVPAGWHVWAADRLSLTVPPAIPFMAKVAHKGTVALSEPVNVSP